MLTSEQRAIVKSTVPLLETGGETLATHFYQKLLDQHPELQPLFNQAHQASGAQPRALAKGVLMYARHIDELDQLGDLVAKIINKHVSLNIQPEHYPMVGGCLLASIREVLGSEIATDEVIDAWGAAYGQLADILIGLEKNLYDAKEEAPGGWRGTRAFRVSRKVVESREITSFYLTPVDGSAVLDFKPGQYTGLRLIINGKEVRRNYSLSAPSNGREYRISVKREPNGLVSNHLHDHVDEGDVLDVFTPSGNFTLAAGTKPLVLLSGGVGITPMIPMVFSALETGRPVVFIHCARSTAVQAFRETIHTLALQYPQLKTFYCYRHNDAAASAETAAETTAKTTAANHPGRLDQALLESYLPTSRDVDVYFLGPLSFMKAMRQHLRAIGIAEAQTHYEFFGPASSLD